MIRRKRSYNDDFVAALKPKASRYSIPDSDQRSLYIRVTPLAARSYVAVARDPNGKQVWATLGAHPDLAIADAREQARAVIKRIKAGLPAVAPEIHSGSFRDVAETWFKSVVENRHRTAAETRRCLNTYIFPAWADRPFAGIRRRDLTALLDVIEKRGRRQADVCLTIIRSLTNWYESREDDYVSPVAKGMRRDTAPSRARILDDAEIRAVWNAGEGTFGALVRFALLTGQRRQKLSELRWSDIVDGAWRIPDEHRAKGSGGVLVLPQLALDVIAAQPRLVSNPHVFAGRGGGPFNSFSDGKDKLDSEARIRSPWVFHDLRRTARSLMARAGVRPDIAERVVGHVIGGVEGIYDRHHYTAEKGEALQRLADLIEKILADEAGATPTRKEVVEAES